MWDTIGLGSPDTAFLHMILDCLVQRIIKSQHEKTMLDMEKITQSINDTIEKYKEFIEDNDSYR